MVQLMVEEMEADDRYDYVVLQVLQSPIWLLFWR